MTDDLDTTGRLPAVRSVATLSDEERAAWESRYATRRPEPSPCPHPESSRLRNVGATWCPWCQRGGIEERADSVLGVLRYLGAAHAWRLAEALGESRRVVSRLLHWLEDQGRVRPAGVVRVRHRDGTRVELTLWRVR